MKLIENRISTSINKRTILNRKPIIPYDYQQVEWVDCNKASSINNGIMVSKSGIGRFEAYLDMSGFESSSKFNALWGQGDPYRTIQINKDGSKNARDLVVDVLNWNHTNYKGTLSLKGHNTNQTSYTMKYLFYSGRSGYDGTQPMPVYWCKLYDINENLVMHLIPCYRKSDNEIGFYDLISEGFYINTGTGTFLKGNDMTQYKVIKYLVDERHGTLPEPYQEVEWVDFNKKTDIKNGIKVSVSNIKKLETKLDVGALAFQDLQALCGNGNAYTTISARKLSTTGIEFDSRDIPLSDRYFSTELQSTNIGVCSFTCTTTCSLTYLGYSGRSGYDIAKTTPFYYFKLYNIDNELIYHFIPCYNKITGEIGFYEKIAHKFYGNSGSGTLLKGPKVLLGGNI